MQNHKYIAIWIFYDEILIVLEKENIYSHLILISTLTYIDIYKNKDNKLLGKIKVNLLKM